MCVGHAASLRRMRSPLFSRSISRRRASNFVAPRLQRAVDLPQGGEHRNLGTVAAGRQLLKERHALPQFVDQRALLGKRRLSLGNIVHQLEIVERARDAPNLSRCRI